MQQESNIDENYEVTIPAKGDLSTPLPKTAATVNKKSAREAVKGYFTATRMSYIAIFTAISFVFYLLHFSILPAVPFLEIDFSNTFVMVAGFSLGPVAGVIVGVLKEVIHGLTMTTTAFVGELANILFILPYVLIPSIIYRKHKGIKTVIVSLVFGSVAQWIVSIPVNWLLNFPAYMMAFTGSTWKEGMDFFLEVWYWALLFNVIKSVMISVVVFFLYKPLSSLIKATNARFDKLAKKKTIANNRFSDYNLAMKTFVSLGPEQTADFAAEYAKNLKPGDVVLLEGDMGAGKTVFAKGVAKGLGIEDEITSPTYAYMNDYYGKLYHYDCYRLTSGEQAEGLGLTDYFRGDGICLVEWAENIASVLPSGCRRVTIKKTGENIREITYEQIPRD